MILEEIRHIVRQPSRADFEREARLCGFDLCGIAPARELDDYAIYNQWVNDGLAGPLTYLSDHRADLRRDPRSLLSSARSVLCVGRLYRTKPVHPTHGVPTVSSYAWGSADYHDLLRDGLTRLAARLQDLWGPFEYKICVDTSPFLDRSFARAAGLGWIGKNTCLINQPLGSWFFLGAIVASIEPNEANSPPPDRCGTCTRCIDACPTQALVPAPPGGPNAWRLDARLCISTWTIEQRGPLTEQQREATGAHLFGCDICQDVCPWNRRSPATDEPGFQPVNASPDLEEMASMTREQFRDRFRRTPVWRAHWEGWLRNVATAMGNSGERKYAPALERLAHHEDEGVAEHARWALSRLEQV